MLQKLESDTAFAENFLGILSNSFKSLSTTDQEALRTLLNHRKIIPTKYGMYFPDQAYLSSVTILPDLPTVCLKKPRRVLEPFFTFLGVRKHVELQLIFDRLIAQGNWDHINLVKYLISKVDDITPDEKEKLRTNAIWPCEDEREIKKHLISDLYAPLPELRELGLLVIKWNKRWSDNLAEGKVSWEQRNNYCCINMHTQRQVLLLRLMLITSSKPISSQIPNKSWPSYIPALEPHSLTGRSFD